jgi:chemotaxis protein histidine kinase CheA
MKIFKDLLIELNACSEAREWSGDKTIEEVLRDSWRGDWLLWLAKKLDLPLRPLTLAKARCAKTVIHLMKDQRSINAVNVAERFGLDECTLEELDDSAAAAAAAYADAADAAYAAATYSAAAAAAYAAYSAAAYAAYDAYADAADRKKNQQQTSDICVEILGELLINDVNKRLTK